MVEADWEKRTLPEELTDECRKLYTEAVGEGWREVAGTIIMDKNNTVVGFRMHFVKDGKESKEVVVPASPELAEQYDMEEGSPSEGQPLTGLGGGVAVRSSDSAVSESPPPTLPEKNVKIPFTEEQVKDAFKRQTGGIPEKKGKNPWAK